MNSVATAEVDVDVSGERVSKRLRVNADESDMHAGSGSSSPLNQEDEGAEETKSGDGVETGSSITATPAEKSKTGACMDKINQMLPKTGTTWHVMFQNPEMFLVLIRIASQVLTDRICFYPTKSDYFEGIVIDEMAPSQVALMFGRLCCDVHIADGSPEVPVTVPTESLLATLKGAGAVQSIAMYQTKNSSNVFFSILDPTSGHVHHDDIPTLCSSAHSTLRPLRYQFELTFQVRTFKDDISRVFAKGIAEVQMKILRVSDTVVMLTLSGSGEKGNAFAALPIIVAPTQHRVCDRAAEVDSTDVANTVARLTADSKGTYRTDNVSLEGIVPVSREAIEKLSVLYDASFSVKHLDKMIKPMKDDSQMTIFVGDKPFVLPLVIRFDIDVKAARSSHAAFVMAANT
jgi:hypothetical protein